MKCFGSSIKVYRCKIVMLDETELIQEIKDSQKGQDILDIVFKHLDLLETVYFGLRYIDSKGYSCWLEPNKNAIKQVKDVEPITLFFGVKFYASDPCKLREECTRYQFFLQIKQDIQQSRLPVTNELAAQLLAYIIQSELGDYDPKIHQFGYVSEFSWIENQSLDFENKVCDLHKKLIGQTPAAVEMQFLDRVKWIDLYGCDLHSVVAEDRHEYFLGLGPHGIIVLKNKLKIASYYWPRIDKIRRKAKFFMIKVTDKNNQDKTYGFEMPDRMAAIRIHKSCKEHKEFFQLSQNVPTKNGYWHLDGSKSAMRLMNPDFNRPNPSLVRISSRRFKRIGQPDGSEIPRDAAAKPPPTNQHIELNKSAINRFNSIPSLPKADYGTSKEFKAESGLFSKSASASPLSVRSAFVARYDYGRMNYVSPMKRNASSSSLRRNRSSRSDNDSDVSSKYSKNSSRSYGRRRSGSGSGFESNNQLQRSKRKLGNEPQMVEWNDLMDRRQNNVNPSINNVKQCSSAIVKNVGKLNNSAFDSDSDVSPPNPRYGSKIKNPYKNLPMEIQKYIVPEPIDTSGFTESEKKNIYFTKIRSEAKISQPPNYRMVPNRYRINDNDDGYQHNHHPTMDMYYHYSDQRNLNHHLIPPSNHHSSPRVTFLPTHSTAYYSNNEDYARNVNESKHDQIMAMAGTANNTKHNEMSTEL